jgi:hypothetical protein
MWSPCHFILLDRKRVKRSNAHVVKLVKAVRTHRGSCKSAQRNGNADQKQSRQGKAQCPSPRRRDSRRRRRDFRRQLVALHSQVYCVGAEGDKRELHGGCSNGSGGRTMKTTAKDSQLDSKAHWRGSARFSTALWKFPQSCEIRTAQWVSGVVRWKCG